MKEDSKEKGLIQGPRDISGSMYDRLTVVDKAFTKNGNSHWNCICKCGNKVTVSRPSLRSGHTKSCGCINKCRDGDSRLPTYNSWSSMVDRCTNKKSKNYSIYGGAGIGICERWLDYKAFKEDLGERPEGKTLDRIDNANGYCPENCRWATYKEQQNNTKKTRFITFNGEKKPANVWAEEKGMHPRVLRWRLNKGWSMKKTLTTPVKKRSALDNICPCNFGGRASEGASPYSTPLEDIKKAKYELSQAHFSPNPEGIQSAIYKRYPELHPKFVRENDVAKKKTKAQKKVETVMSEFKDKTLNIGKSKKKVKSRKQATAIAMSEAGLSKKKKKSKAKKKKK